MRKQAKTSALIAFIAGLPAIGMAVTAAEIDVNGDGMLTIDEVQQAFPDMAVDTFTTMDLNADGALDADEVAAGQEAGLMPTSDG